jgi:hypothetical protein
MIFQAMFAIITVALITGAIVERVKFSALVLFSVLWLTFVYSPVAHWVWGTGGWIRILGPLILQEGLSSTSVLPKDLMPSAQRNSEERALPLRPVLTIFG